MAALQNFRKKLLRNRVLDLEQAAKLRNVAGVQEILGSSVDCVHTYPDVCFTERGVLPVLLADLQPWCVVLQPFRRAHDEVLRVMECQGRGCTPDEYQKVKTIHELFVVSAITVAPTCISVTINPGRDACRVGTGCIARLQAAKGLCAKEFALLQLIDWIRKGDARLVERYLDTQSGNLNINAHTSRVRSRCVIRSAFHVCACFI